jgi:hypothetical protein
MIALWGIHSYYFLWIAGILLVIAIVLAGIEDSKDDDEDRK